MAVLQVWNWREGSGLRRFGALLLCWKSFTPESVHETGKSWKNWSGILTGQIGCWFQASATGVEPVSFSTASQRNTDLNTLADHG